MAQKQFPVIPKTKTLMGHYNHSILFDAKLMVIKSFPLVSEHVAVNIVVQ